jgi:hypothetical protein
MVCGELDRYPASIFIRGKMIGLWQRIVCGEIDNIAHRLYNVLYNTRMRGLYHSKWLCNVKETLNTCCLSEAWLYQRSHSFTHMLNVVKQRLMEQYTATRTDSVYNTAKCLNLSICLTNHCFEKYVTLLHFPRRQWILRLACLPSRCSLCHCDPAHTRRWCAP